MRTTVESVFAAGDGAGIGGARLAVIEGALAAHAACADLGYQRTDALANELQWRKRAHAQLEAVRTFLAETFRWRPERMAKLPDETILCRCEEVKLGAVRDVIKEGVRSLHEVRVLCRVGMGPCQGRYCTTSALRWLSKETGRTLEELGSDSPRPPIRPLSADQFASVQGA
jgi:hypothetical protein